jgi:hypothetical protein
VVKGLFVCSLACFFSCPALLTRLLAVMDSRLKEAKIPMAFWRFGGKGQPRKRRRRENRKSLQD